jgi:hypothetical protein
MKLVLSTDITGRKRRAVSGCVFILELDGHLMDVIGQQAKIL